MARIRSIHPGLWTDEAFVSVSPLARLLHVGIWNECDDQGAFEWKPITLKMRLLPNDNADLSALLAELVGANMVARYSVNGRDYGAVRNFGRFQRPKKPKSTHPMPSEWRKYAGSDGEGSEPEDDETPSGSAPPHADASSVGNSFPTSSTLVPLAAEKSPQMEEEGDKRKEEDRSLRSLVRSRAAKADPDFAAFYAAYPRHEASDDGLKAWRSVASQGVNATDIMAGLAKFRFNPDPQFIPLPASWLRGGRWKDEPVPVGAARQSFQRRESVSEERRRKLGIPSVFDLMDDLDAPATQAGETNHVRIVQH